MAMGQNEAFHYPEIDAQSGDILLECSILWTGVKQERFGPIAVSYSDQTGKPVCRTTQTCPSQNPTVSSTARKPSNSPTNDAQERLSVTFDNHMKFCTIDSSSLHDKLPLGMTRRLRRSVPS
jgi:hypothetical protein